jgi:hypothetical protein
MMEGEGMEEEVMEAEDTPEGRGSGLTYAFLLGLGILSGALLMGAIRYVNLEPPPHVHFHANWALFADGQRVDLTADRYMEDVAQCMADPANQRPEDRVHMHNGDADVIHVHDAGATWGHFLANLGMGIGDDYIEIGDARMANDEAKSLKFVLNGNRIRSLRNLTIVNRDRLLISFGSEPVETVISTQFPQVAENAETMNTHPDPASCSGNVEETTSERLRRAFWF